MEAGGWIGLGANAVVSVAFLAVAVVLAVGAIRTKQVRNNPLGVATVLLYVTCGGGHVVHTIQLAEASGAQTEYLVAWDMAVLDVLTAIAGVAYWMMRRRFPALVSSAAVYEDLRVRQRRALEIHDGVVQGLVRAKMALDLDLKKEGDEAVDDTLAKARGIISGLLGDKDVQPGALRRATPGGASHGR